MSPYVWHFFFILVRFLLCVLVELLRMCFLLAYVKLMLFTISIHLKILPNSFCPLLVCMAWILYDNDWEIKCMVTYFRKPQEYSLSAKFVVLDKSFARRLSKYPVWVHRLVGCLKGSVFYGYLSPYILFFIPGTQPLWIEPPCMIMIHQ